MRIYILSLLLNHYFWFPFLHLILFCLKLFLILFILLKFFSLILFFLLLFLDSLLFNFTKSFFSLQSLSLISLLLSFLFSLLVWFDPLVYNHHHFHLAINYSTFVQVNQYFILHFCNPLLWTNNMKVKLSLLPHLSPKYHQTFI